MRQEAISRCAVVMLSLAWFWCAVAPAFAQEARSDEGKKGRAADATTVKPVRVDVLSLQVSKLPRDQFGHGIKPVTNENVAFWLANAGTAVDLRITLDRNADRFVEGSSRVLRFVDDRGGDLTKPRDDEPINTFFPDNKLILVKPGPRLDEAEVILRAPGVPKPGATRIKVHADLVFLAGSDEQTAEVRDLEPKPGTSATIGPVKLKFRDPKDLPAPPRGFPRPGNAPAPTIAFDYQPVEKAIRSLALLGPDGRAVTTVDGSSFNGTRGGTVWFTIPAAEKVHLKVIYYEKASEITVPIRIETGVGF
ncbi:MAG: hypothetical protein ACYC61_30510 [Isosphaeraceae bacterium]